jgi:hypothetical protein
VVILMRQVAEPVFSGSTLLHSGSLLV